MAPRHRSGERPVDLAEQALVGAMLLDPSRLHDVASWLSPDAFDDPGLAAVYGVVSQLHREGAPADVQAVRQGLLDASVHPRWAEGPYLVTLMQACPLEPDHVAYGRMVLEGSLRRQLLALGQTVETASQHAVQNPDAPAVGTVVGQALSHLDGQAARWSLAHGKGDASVGEIGQLPRIPSLAGSDDTEALQRAERTVVAAAVTSRTALEDFAGRLTPRDFNEPELGNTYAAVVSLAEQGKPVDVVTVAWESQRLSPQNGPALPAGDLRRLTAVPPVPAAPQRELELVLAESLRRKATAAREALGLAAHNPGITPDDLLASAALTYEAIEATAARMAPTQTRAILQELADVEGDDSADDKLYEHPTHHLSLVPQSVSTT